MQRQLKHRIHAFKVNMGGILLDQALPSTGVENIDPFLLLHHAKALLPAGGDPRDHGVGPHPHRGFSPVTFVIKGTVRHQDSRGNIAEVSDGGVQWMHSGMGIIHSERPSRSYLEKGGEYEIIQVWINSPASSKRKQPSYKPLNSSDIPSISMSKGGALKLISGTFEDETGPIQTESPMQVFWLNAKKDESVIFKASEHYNTVIYIIEGGLELESGDRHFSKELLSFDHSADSLNLSFTADTQLIYLAGQPIEEKIVSHGPYVMNSETEIMEAMRDYQMGKMGILVEEFN